MKAVKWALFLSGRGSTTASFLDVISELDVRLVVSSKKKAKGLARAKAFGVPTLIFEKDWAKLVQELKKRGITHIFLLGFMKLVPESLIKPYQGRIFNVHPSLLPQFPGLNAMKLSFENKKNMGVTVHHVIPEMDAGQIIKQQRIFLTESTWEWAQIKMAFMEQKMIREVGQKKNTNWNTGDLI